MYVVFIDKIVKKYTIIPDRRQKNDRDSPK